MKASSLTRAARVFAALLIAWLASLSWPGSLAEARADNVAKLSRTLTHSHNHKRRIAAAVSLAKLADPRSLPALIKALRDEHRTVRALAAAALGRIGDQRALPALRRAARDSNPAVRKRARQAIAAIGKRSDARSGYKVSSGRGVPGFGRNPRGASRPTIYVVLKSTADKSDGRASSQVRESRARHLERLFRSELKASPEVTTSSRVARKLRIERHNLDASITRLSRRVNRDLVEIQCRVRVAVSDERGKMLSFLTGTATVKVPRRSFDQRNLPQLRLEAMENAIKGIRQDLLRYLRQSSRRGS